MANLRFHNDSTNEWEVIKVDTIGGVIPNNQTWTATQGQTVFTIPNGQIADPKLISIYVNHLIRTDFVMTNNTTFQFATSLNSGDSVYAEWFEVSVPATIGHHSTHELNGQDPIDVTKLTNYQEQISTPITNLQNDLSGLETNVTNHENNTSNPHAVTASQVGAYSKTEADSLLSGKLTSNATNTRIESQSAILFTNGGSTRAYATVTFSKAFTSPPNVFPMNITQTTSYSDVIYYPFIYGVTTTGFNVRVESVSDLGILGDPKNIFMGFMAIGS